MPPSIKEHEVGVEGLLLVALPARTPHLLALRELLDSFAEGCAASSASRATVAAALTETLCSVARHGDGQGRDDVVELLADAEENFLDVIVRHSGAGISVLRASDGESSSYGLRLLTELADKLSIDDRPDGRVELWMRFDIT